VVDNEPQPKFMDPCAALCATLSEPKRMMLLYHILKQPRNVSDLAEAAGISPSSASRHLKVLKSKGVVTAKREKRGVVYRPRDPRLIQALDLLLDIAADTLLEQASFIQEEVEEGEIGWLP